MKPLLKKVMIGSAGLVLFSSPAMAAWTFSDADLVIGFQATGGEGATTNLFFNLGDSYEFNQGNFTYGFQGNINDDLTAAYGAGWASRTDLYFGVFANRSNLTATIDPGVDGVSDPGRTIYLSAPTPVVGGAALRGQLGSASLGNGASSYAGLRTNLTGATGGGFTETGFGDGVATLNQAAQPVEWNNSWTVRNPTPGAAFAVFTSGIQQQFGTLGPNNIVDIQRMTPSSPTTYVGSVIIGNNGDIALVPEPSTSLLAAFAGALVAFRRRRNA
jgi:hypothetical protein